jgi:hypothetical protein
VAKQTLTEQVAALRRQLAKMDKRVAALEEMRTRELTCAIGFEVEEVEVGDEEEYRRRR